VTTALESLFQKTPEQDDEEELVINPESPIESLVGDDKKYKTPLDLAKAVLEKDRFIKQIKTENAMMRDQFKTAGTAQELLDKLLKQQQTQGKQAESLGTTQDASQQDQGNANDGVSLDQIKQLLEERERVNAENANIRAVRETLEKDFGADWQNRLQKVANEYSMSVQEIEELARKRPQAVIKMSKPTSMASPTGTPQSTIQVLPGSTSQVRNQKYYTELQRKLKPAEFFNPKIQNQLFKDADSLGPKFFE
jgi:hypothetical protein